MDYEEELYDAIIYKITEVVDNLSDEAKKHIATRKDTEDYMETIKRRFYCEDYDESDFELLKLLLVLIQYYLDE